MFRRAKRRIAGRTNFDTDDTTALKQLHPSSIYKTRLSFYDIPPTDEITLEEFESWAIDRLHILIEIDSCVARSKSIKEIELTIRPLLLKYLPLSALTPTNEDIVFHERRKDHYSHFILRLAFCRTEEMRKKFVKNETLLFKVRYGLLQPLEQQDFISHNKDKLPWQYISEEEKDENFESLYAASAANIKSILYAENADLNFSITPEQLRQLIKKKENFIKLPFEKVTNLVAARQVFLKKGFAYIAASMQLSLLAVEFQESLEKNVLRTFQTIPRLEDDDRLLPLLSNLSRNFSSMQYESLYGNDPSMTSDINANSIVTPPIMKHYPLCAKHLQKNLIYNSHLKYQGRQQLGLFLKGIGLGIDEALKFWNHQFTKSGKMTTETFNKEYRYNIRHNYGLEGARIKYRPWDCGSILLKPKPGKGEYHGCPYRDFSIDSLTNNLNEMGITDKQELNTIIDDVGRKDYTIACTRVFELTHKSELAKKPNSEALHINHPNLYFDRSRQLEKYSA